MISIEEAKTEIFARLGMPVAENIPLEQAIGRWAACDISAPADLPPFDNSAMDGYAVRSADTRGASAENPISLRCIARLGAGEPFEGVVPSKSCVRLFTGSVLPYGADAVVMQEDTRRDGEMIHILAEAKALENVRLRGEDVRAGMVIVSKGERISPGNAGLLAACGMSSVATAMAPSVALLATGNELREPGETLNPGQIHESNRTLLEGLLREIGIKAERLPLVRDTLEETESALRGAFERNQVVITSGGVSVGELDFVKEAFERLGGKIELWKIAMRPGKPFVFGEWKGRYLFGLPGNPVSAFVTFMKLARPALLKLQGAGEVELPEVEALLADELANTGDRRHLMRVRIECGRIYKAGTQASHMIGKLGKANALVDVPPATVWPAGSRVRAEHWMS